MATSSVNISSPSYVAGVVSASAIWGLVWYVYSLRSNAKHGDKQIQPIKEEGSVYEESIYDDGGSQDGDRNSKKSLPIWKMMWESVRVTTPGGDGKGQNEKNNGNSGQPLKKRMRWRWESIRKKNRNNRENTIDCDYSVVVGDASSGLKTKGLGKSEAVDSSSQPQHPDEHGEAGVNNDKSRNQSRGGIQTKNGSDDVSLEEKSGLCIGSIFGLDIGGTLSKLVYFQRTPEDKEQKSDDSDEVPPQTYHQSKPDLADIVEGAENDEGSFTRSFRFMLTSSEDHPPQSKSRGVIGDISKPKLRKSMSDVPQKSAGMKRVRSMFDMAKSKFERRARALSNFYTLVSRLVDRDSGVKEDNLSFHSPSLGGEFHFIKFETRYMTHAMEVIRAHSLHLNIVQMGATGGGAHKYANPFIENLGIQMATKGEMDSLVAGMQFVLSDVDKECYTFEPNEDMTREHKPSCYEDEFDDPLSAMKIDKVNVTNKPENLKEECPDENMWARKVKREFWTRKIDRDVVAKSDSYPYMIVIIGTGVSVLRIDGVGKFERISGSTIGGGTYWGLCRLLTDVEDYESVLNLAERGKSSKVDMMVGDIYGKKVDVLEKYGLTADVVASSFGKLVAKTEPAAGLKQEDLARALLLMVTNNIGQVAYLNAQIHNTKRIYFIGNFLRHNVISQQRLAYAINYWSKGKMEALFLEHEGYLGALGAYLLHQGLLGGKAKASKKHVSKVDKKRQKARSMSM